MGWRYFDLEIAAAADVLRRTRQLSAQYLFVRAVRKLTRRFDPILWEGEESKVRRVEPALAEMLAVVSQDPEIIKYAKSKGAKGINLAGMCCTANEILMRHGIPIAGNYLQQELAIVTGALDAMVVDVQCIMQGLKEVADCFHTKLITTDNRAKITGERISQ